MMEAVKLKTLDGLILSPQERVELIAYELDGNSYQVTATPKEPEQGRLRIPPFDAIELDLSQLLGGPQ